MPPAPGDAAGLREANRRLRELLLERDAQLAAQAEVNGLGKPAPKSLRTKTGRGPGRPKGQPGATMELTDHPDHVVRHEPSCCAGCGAGLGSARQTGTERRQVTEIPPVKAEVTEHQLIERECAGCGAKTKAQPPDGVNAPAQYGPRAAALGTYLWHGQFLSRDRAEAERVIRMSKLRIKVSGCMRSMTGAETFCTIRSYLATATRHGISWLDALTQAAQGDPWIPDTT